MLIFALSVFASALGGADPCKVITDGPAEGMCSGPIVQRTGNFAIVSLLPGSRPGPALSPEMTRVLSGLLDSRRDMLPAFPRELLAEGATGEFCTKFSDECFKRAPLKPWTLDKEFTPARPYLLKDGRIRLEWMRDGKLEYLSFIRWDGAKVIDISTVPAMVPMMMH